MHNLQCLLQVRMSTNHAGGSDGTWRCQIKLRREYDKNNKQLDSKPDEEAFKTLAQARALGSAVFCHQCTVHGTTHCLMPCSALRQC